MGSHTVYTAIREHLAANWTATPLAWENEAFTPPDPLAAWVAVEITGDVYARQSIGAGSADRWDEEGSVLMHVFVPAGTGSATAREHCKALADLFRGTLLLSGSLEFRDATIGLGEVGDDEGATYRISISVAWRRLAA